MTRSPDLVVVGAGVMGAWTAWWARRAGLDTILVDAWGAGNPRATSSDETRISRASHGRDRFYPLWSRRARELWIELGEAWGQQLFVASGALWFAHREDGFEATSLATLTELGIPVERVELDEARARWPQVGTDDLAFVIYRARGRVPHVAPRRPRRGGRVPARRRTGGDGRGPAGPGRAAGGSSTSSRRTARGSAPSGSCSPPVRGCPALFPDLLGELIAVTRQDVLFVGPAPGDDRFGAGPVAGVGRLRRRVLRRARAPTAARRRSPPTGTARPSIRRTASGSSIRPRSRSPATSWRGASRTSPAGRSSRPGSASTRRRPTRTSSSTVTRPGQRLDRRWRIGPRVQARAADRRVRRRAPARRAGRPGRGALLVDPPARRAGRAPQRVLGGRLPVDRQRTVRDLDEDAAVLDDTG